MKILHFSTILLVFTVSCGQLGDDSKLFSQHENSQSERSIRQGLDAEVDTMDSLPPEDVEPPANISGSYLISCQLTDKRQLRSSPAQASFSCAVTDMDGAPAVSDGQWLAALLTPNAGENIQVADPKLGSFRLTASKPEQLVSAIGRVVLTFKGTVGGREALLTETGKRSLLQEVVNVQAIIEYTFTVQIVSGSRVGRTYTGSFAYDSSLLTGRGQETLQALNLKFDYLPATQQLFDSVGSLLFADGRFLSLNVQGGPTTERFGINSGFNRNQFGRVEETFVRIGDQYFGYMGPNLIVDGAGTIRYTPR